MFGEILSALGTITAVAAEARKNGEPYGPLTMRLIRAARRETETYVANRTLLYDIGDAEIRIRMHVLMVQIVLALEGVSDTSAAIAASEAALANPRDGVVSSESRRLVLFEQREAAFQFVLTVAERIKALVRALQPIAKVDFDEMKRFSGNPFAPVEDGS
jgi:hypothetical protein